MLTIHNKTQHPIRVPLPGHKILHLGPEQSGEIADDAASFEPLARLVQAGEIEIGGHQLEATPNRPQADGGRRAAPFATRRTGVRGDR